MTEAQRAFMILAIISFCVAAGPVARLINAYQKDVYWTHTKHPLGLDAAKGHVQVYVAGERLDEALKGGRLHMTKDGKTFPLVAKDVGLRVNRLHEFTRMDVVFSTVLLTMGAVFLALLVIVTLAHRSGKSAPPPPANE